MREPVDKVNQSGGAPAPAAATADAVMDLVHRLMHRFRALQYQGLREGPQAVTIARSSSARRAGLVMAGT